MGISRERAGVHTGECEVCGIGVHIGARCATS
jgi:hypothetical protein